MEVFREWRGRERGGWGEGSHEVNIWIQREIERRREWERESERKQERERERKRLVETDVGEGEPVPTNPASSAQLHSVQLYCTV